MRGDGILRRASARVFWKFQNRMRERPQRDVEVNVNCVMLRARERERFRVSVEIVREIARPSARVRRIRATRGEARRNRDRATTGEKADGRAQWERTHPPKSVHSVQHEKQQSVITRSVELERAGRKKFNLPSHYPFWQ